MRCQKCRQKNMGHSLPQVGPYRKKPIESTNRLWSQQLNHVGAAKYFSVLTLWSTTTDASKSASQTKSCCVRPGGVLSLTICSTPKHCMMVGEIVFSGLVWNKFGQKGYTNRIYLYIITGEQLSIWLEIETDSRFQFPKLTTTLTSGIY